MQIFGQNNIIRPFRKTPSESTLDFSSDSLRRLNRFLGQWINFFEFELAIWVVM